MKLGSIALLLFVAQLALAQSDKSAQIARGRYLVRHVAMCGDCHTPRDQKGMPLPGKELGGAPLAFKPLNPMPWADAAPPIAGLAGWKDDEVVTFLTTGKLNGGAPRPPMPEYRFNTADARAVVAYVRSLGANSASGSKAPTSAAK